MPQMAAVQSGRLFSLNHEHVITDTHDEQTWLRPQRHKPADCVVNGHESDCPLCVRFHHFATRVCTEVITAN